ncbi:MAG TPA: P-loop NTPase fold protein, partial [Candidatus Eremiobacteraceae bacterium]|nr:P-loop NTPase fold protein [Candidatus Eremiobacteraceae bacterium]
MAFLSAQYRGEHWNRIFNPSDGPKASEPRPENISSEVLQRAGASPNAKPKPAQPSAPTVNVNFTPDTGTLNLNAPPSAGTAPIVDHDSEGLDAAQGRLDSSSETPDSTAASVSDPTVAARANPLVGRYTADDPYATADDLLDIESEASAFARIVAARSIRPPLAIGIFGEWGSGKTYFMRRIQSQVEQLRLSSQAAETTGLFYSDIVQIRFNAWHYIETNLWASLVEYIFSALDTWIQHKASGDQNRTDLIFNRLATAQQLQIDALENVVKLRAQQHSAELRAQRARQDYADALAKSTRVKPDAYIRAMLDTFLADNHVAKKQLEAIGSGLAIPQLETESERLTDILSQARSESGRAKLITHSLATKLGTWPAIVTIALIVFALPGLTMLIKALAERLPALAWVKDVHDANIQIAVVLLAATTIVRIALSQVRAAVKKLTLFDQKLQENIDKQVAEVNQSTAVKEALAANQSLLNCRQAVDAAERGLLDANAKLANARQEFESGTARGRLNAFVRAKVTDGDYAKHLGIIASIRKDFVQLASLMSEANDSDEERKERLRLRDESALRVKRFLSWLKDASDVRLTLAEVRSLFTLLDPSDAVAVFDEYFAVLEQHFDETPKELSAVKVDLQDAQSIELPRFSRIVLYIDDLDRCPPDKVVNVLQAVHLLLCFPLFVVVVAVDARWVSRALHERFPGLLAEGPEVQELLANPAPPPRSGASSDDYLEKIFQIPYWVRAMEAKAAA